jgi:predicted nucleic acid-binding protein
MMLQFAEIEKIISVSLSRDAKADFLITRDRDLLDLIKFENTFIVTLHNFLKS